MNINVSGYTVIVTGGTRGIGKAITEIFINEGSKVIAIYSSDEKSACELKNKYPDKPLEVVKLNIADYSAVESFFAEFGEKYNSLDVLVNNAGIRKDNIVAMMPDTDWEEVIKVNLGGTYIMSKFAVKKMLEKRFGRIIIITSPSGKIGFPGQANYAASKAAQVAFCKSLAKETAKKKITVNCVSPGFIDTDFIADLPDELKKEYKSQIPMRRFGKPEEIAWSVLYLSSDYGAYITGSVVEVTGGL